MITPDILNLTGLGFNILGTLMIFIYTPTVSGRVYVFNRSEQDKIDERTRRKNRAIRFGMLFLCIGILLQVAAIFSK